MAASKKRPSQTDRVAVDRARIERARAKRDKSLKGWRENIRYFIGDQWESLTLGANENEITVNKIFPVIRAQLPSLIFSDPHYTVSSTKASVDENQNDAKEHLVNFLFGQAEGGYAARMSVLSAFFAIGCVKVGYTPNFVANPKRAILAVGEAGEPLIDHVDEQGRAIPKLESGEFIKDDKGNLLFGSDGVALMEPPDIMVDEDFFIRWVPFDTLLFDPEGTNDFRTHRWVAEEWVRPTEDVRADPLLKNTANIKPSHSVDDKKSGEAEPFGIDKDAFDQLANEAIAVDEGRTRGWTIYDFEAKRIRVIADTGDAGKGDGRYLRDDEMPPELWDRGPKHGGPFCFLMFNEVPGRWEPLPDVEPLKSLQDELNMQRSKISTHLRRADRKYLYEDDFLADQEQWDHLEGGGDMSFAQVDNKDAVKALDVAPMDPGIFTALPTTAGDFDEIAGAAEQRGVARSDSATQAAVLENRQQIRESDRRDNIIRKHLIDTGSKLLKTVQANMILPQYVKIGDTTKRQPYTFAGEIAPDEIDGDFDVTMDVASIQPRTNAVFRQQALSFLQNVFMPMISNPISAQFVTPQLLDELFELFGLGNTELADQLAEVANMIATQAQGGGASPGTGQSPDQVTGSIGELTSQLNGGTANPLGGLPTPTGG